MAETSNNPNSRNPLFPEGTFKHGDYVKIAAMSGLSRATVVDTLVYRRRKNQEVIKAAQIVAQFNKRHFKN